MKKKKLIITVGSIIVFLICIVYAFTRKGEKTVNKSESTITLGKIQNKTKLVSKKERTQQPNSITPPRPTNIPEKLWNSLVEVNQDDINKNIPIEFHGKVIDQFENPVDNAEININVRKTESLLEELKYNPWNDVNPVPPGKDYILHSNSDGIFSFKGFGKTLSFNKIEKKGYITNNHPSVRTLYSDPNKKNSLTFSSSKPFIFTLVNKSECEPLYVGKMTRKITYNEDYYIGFDGRILKKNPFHDSELIIRVERRNVRKSNNKNRKIYNWNCTLKALDGEITDTTKYIYIAPKIGYKKSVTFTTEDLKKWQSSITKSYFFYNKKNNIYSLINLVVDYYYDRRIAFTIEYFLNPSGSRNLAYDYEKRLERYPE